MDRRPRGHRDRGDVVAERAAEDVVGLVPGEPVLRGGRGEVRADLPPHKLAGRGLGISTV